MQYKPHRKLKPLVIVCFPLLVITLTFWGLTYLRIGPLGANQLGTVVALTALVYLLLRYALTDFVYTLPESEPVLTVTKIAGRLPRAVADLRLSRGDCLIPYEKGAAKREGIIRTENFCVSLFPEESWLYVTVIEGKKVALRLECKADTAAYLQAAIDALPTEEDLV